MSTPSPPLLTASAPFYLTHEYFTHEHKHNDHYAKSKKSLLKPFSLKGIFSKQSFSMKRLNCLFCFALYKIKDKNHE